MDIYTIEFDPELFRRDFKELYPFVWEYLIEPLEEDGAIDLRARDVRQSFDVIHARLADALAVDIESVLGSPREPWPVEADLTPAEATDMTPPSVAMAELERRLKRAARRESTGPRPVE